MLNLTSRKRAIKTKVLPATNYRCSRIKAFDSCGNSATIIKPSEDLREAEAHARAALALMEKMRWTAEILTTVGFASGEFVHAMFDRDEIQDGKKLS